jgi:hypothetical protein
MKICPEEWGDSFGSEFYDFSLDNSLYYAPVNQSWGISQKSRPVNGQISFSLLTPQEVLENATLIRTRLEDNNE